MCLWPLSRGWQPIGAGDKPVLLVVDMIREFVDHRWPTGHSETGYVLRGGG